MTDNTTLMHHDQALNNVHRFTRYPIPDIKKTCQQNNRQCPKEVLNVVVVIPIMAFYHIEMQIQTDLYL